MHDDKIWKAANTVHEQTMLCNASEPANSVDNCPPPPAVTLTGANFMFAYNTVFEGWNEQHKYIPFKIKISKTLFSLMTIYKE
jgi:hypothetical protein